MRIAFLLAARRLKKSTKVGGFAVSFVTLRGDVVFFVDGAVHFAGQAVEEDADADFLGGGLDGKNATWLF